MNESHSSNLASTETPERKSELRLALEGCLFKRAKKARDGELTYGLSAKRLGNGRWTGEAWFRDESGELTRVTVAGLLSAEELGNALLGAIETIGA